MGFPWFPISSLRFHNVHRWHLVSGSVGFLSRLLWTCDRCDRCGLDMTRRGPGNHRRRQGAVKQISGSACTLGGAEGSRDTSGLWHRLWTRNICKQLVINLHSIRIDLRVFGRFASVQSVSHQCTRALIRPHSLRLETQSTAWRCSLCLRRRVWHVMARDCA